MFQRKCQTNVLLKKFSAQSFLRKKNNTTSFGKTYDVYFNLNFKNRFFGKLDEKIIFLIFLQKSVDICW